MATSPILGIPLPNSGGTDQVPADQLTAWTAAEAFFVGRFANASTRDTKITTPTGGMVAWLTSPGKFTYYDAILGAWADLMNPGVWTSFTPTLQSTGGVAMNLGSGATQVGRYSQTGKTVQFQCQWNFGTSVSGAAGQNVFLLPPGLPGANVAGLGQTGPCSLFIPNQSPQLFMGFWTINPGGTYAQPHLPASPTGNNGLAFFANPTASDGTGGVPLISGTSFNFPVQPNGTFVASGTYQIA